VSLMMEHPPAPANIMIVDDDPDSLNLLDSILRQQQYEVLSFPRGRLALAAADRNPPDLILLDVNMPEMNGFEVCEQLKSSTRLSDIPVIFLTARNAIEDKVNGFQAGGVDYISKPYHLEEVQARVETHLKLHELRRALKLQVLELEETVVARSREIAEANRRLTLLDSAKDQFLSLISHEFCTPLNGLLGVGDIILDGMDSTTENNELREMFEESRRRIISILNDALLLTQIDVSRYGVQPGPVSLSAILKSAIERVAEFAKSRGVRVTPPPAGRDLVLGDQDLLVRALHSLFETAIKFSQEGETVRLAREAGADSLTVIIESRGKRIPDPAMEQFFDPFAISEASTPGKHLGLGPCLAYRILALFGASVSVANIDPSGIRLTISLKRPV
jgi:two-component system sensor histidine kinase/response regulator